MPEPPSIDGGLIGLQPEGVTPLSDPRPVPVMGAAGAATPGARVRVMNLDAQLPLAEVTAAADGSFQLTAMASNGDELRVLALLDGQRSEPADFLFTSELGDRLTPSPRHSCVRLQPGFELALGVSRGSVRFQNDCDAPIQLSEPRFRAGTDFALLTPLPLEVAPGESAPVELELRNAPPPAREDVWFADVTLDGLSLRYPIGVRSGE